MQDGYPMIENVPAGPHGPLANVLAVRRGKGDAQTGGLEHREALIYTLAKAAELEHLIICQYLFAAFSLKRTRRGHAGRARTPVLRLGATS